MGTSVTGSRQGTLESCANVFCPQEEVTGFHPNAAERSAGCPHAWVQLGASRPAPLGTPSKEPPGRAVHGALQFPGRPQRMTRLGGVNDRKLLSLGSGGQKFKSKVSAGQALSAGSKGEPCHRFQLPVAPRVPGFRTASRQPPPVFTRPLLWSACHMLSPFS